MALHDPARHRGGDPEGCLTHPLRRRILRYLHSQGEPCGPPEVAAELEEGISSTNYHMQALAIHGVTREAGLSQDGKSMLYESVVAGNADVIKLLRDTEGQDEGRRAA